MSQALKENTELDFFKGKEQSFALWDSGGY